MLNELKQEKNLSNNKFWRKISDKLDNTFGWVGEAQEKSRIRGSFHCLYHIFIGIGKKMFANNEGSKAEFQRAKIQYERFKNGNNDYEKQLNEEKNKDNK